MESLIINDNIKKSRLPARLDLLQSGTGLFLGLFMWGHMFLVGTILFGKGAFNFVAKTMELAFLSPTGHGYPAAVFFAVSGVFTIFIIHAALALRKFPISWKQHAILRQQMGMLKHEDTNLWYIQAITGFIMFFLGSAHLYMMWSSPGQIGPYLSADRFVAHGFWPLYLILLVSVELHGTIGIYRLCVKWGWFDGKDPKKTRKTLKLLKKRLTIFFLALGGLAYLAFVIIGIGHLDNVGERYDAGHAAVQSPAHEVEAEAQPAPKPEKAVETPAHDAKDAAAQTAPAVQEAAEAAQATIDKEHATDKPDHGAETTKHEE